MDRLHALEAAFGPMQEQIGPLHVGSVLVLDGPPPAADELVSAMRPLLERLPLYRCRVVRMPGELGRPVWADAPGTDVAAHVAHRRLDVPVDATQVRALVRRELERPLDPTRAPWRVSVVSGTGPGWALAVSASHELVDGVTGIGLLTSLLDGADVRALPPLPSAPSTGALALQGAAWAVALPYRAGRALGTWVRDPAARERVALVRAGARQVVHDDLPPTPLSGPLARGRRWGLVARPLDDLVAAGHRAGGTVDDVYLAALSGAYRDLLLASGPAPERGTVRMLVPVSRRGGRDDLRPGTIVGALFVDLPVDLDDPRDRLAEVVARTRDAKRAGVPAATEALLRAGDHVPAPLLAAAARRYARHGQQRVNACATDVRGPAGSVRLLGRRVVSIAPFVPVALDVRLTCALLSYAGTASVGVTVDSGGPDLDVFLASLDHAFAELVAAP